MAHLSTLKKCNLQMKNLKIYQAKRRAEEAKLIIKLGEEDYLKRKKLATSKTLKERADIIIWDIKNHQCPVSKRSEHRKILKERLLEIASETEEKFIKEQNKIKKSLRAIQNG